jgi:hypothetical protein
LRGTARWRLSDRLSWFSRWSLLPVNTEDWREDRHIILVPNADREGRAVGKGCQVLVGTDWYTEERFSIIGLPILSDNVKAAQDRFAFQRLSLFAGQVGDFLEDDHERVGDKQIVGPIADCEIIAILTVEVVPSSEGDGHRSSPSEICQLIQWGGTSMSVRIKDIREQDRSDEQLD